MDNKFSLGNRLRAIRKERHLTQRALAVKADISVNAVSLIERDEISPSVTTLQSLARALSIKMSYFFDDTMRGNTIYLKADQLSSLTGEKIIIESVGQRLPGQQIEPFWVALEPLADSGKQAVMHTGHEFVYVLQGAVEYKISDSVYRLETGDMLIFDAAQPHQWRNLNSEMARMLLLLHCLDEGSEQVRRHFPAYPSLPHID